MCVCVYVAMITCCLQEENLSQVRKGDFVGGIHQLEVRVKVTFVLFANWFVFIGFIT